MPDSSLVTYVDLPVSRPSDPVEQLISAMNLTTLEQLAVELEREPVRRIHAKVIRLLVADQRKAIARYREGRPS